MASNDDEVMGRILRRREKRYGVPELGGKREEDRKCKKTERKGRVRKSNQDKMGLRGVHDGSGRICPFLKLKGSLQNMNTGRSRACGGIYNTFSRKNEILSNNEIHV